MKRNPIK